MLKIDYDIQIGSATFKTPDAARLVSLRCEVSVSSPVNWCRVALTVPADLSPAPGDAVKVKLGHADDGLTQVFSGLVATVEWHADRVEVLAESRLRQLAALRTHEYFENAFAGDIATALAGATDDVATGRVEPGLRFPFFAIGGNRSALAHLQELAGQCGFDLYADADDKLVFGRHLPAGAPAMFGFGQNILAFRLDEAEPLLQGVEVFGESPASSGGGPDAAPWFTKSEVKGSAGSDPKFRVFLPAAREQQTAAQMATNLQLALGPRKSGRLRTWGRADLPMGSLVMVSDMPADAQNGTYKVTGATHQIAPGKGYLTDFQLDSTD